MAEIINFFESAESQKITFQSLREIKCEAVLVETLENTEVQSRTSGNHKTLIGVLRILEMYLCQDESGTVCGDLA